MKEKKHITQTALLERGWSKSMIDHYFPDPLLVENPYYKSAAKMRLYPIQEVEIVECTDEFKQLQEKYMERRQYAKKAVVTKKQNLRKIIDQKIKEIKVEVIPYDKLRKNTLHAKQSFYNFIQDYYQKEEARYAYDADEETIKRWMVNYIRHELTQYEDELYEMSGKVGCHEEYYRYKNAILDEIAKCYPFLHNVCEDQQY